MSARIAAPEVRMKYEGVVRFSRPAIIDFELGS